MAVSTELCRSGQKADLSAQVFDMPGRDDFIINGVVNIERCDGFTDKFDCFKCIADEEAGNKRCLALD